MPALSKREQIVTVALDVFYQNGFNATGVDKIIAEAGVSKKTLYKHFRSKDELVQAVLRKRGGAFRERMRCEAQRLASTPKEKLMQVFDTLQGLIQQEGFSGCLFINASAEFRETQGATRILCADHKRMICEHIQALAEQGEAKNPVELSKQLGLLIEGATVVAHVSGDMDAVARAKAMAEVFVDLALE